VADIKSRLSPFDTLASSYDAWFEAKGKSIFAIELQAFQEILPSLPKPWLEIGIGSGRFAQRLGIEFGLDPSIKLLEIARNRGINVFLGKGERPPFKKRSFGAAFLIVTLCFVDSPLEVLKGSNHILKENGKALLGLVLRESPWGHFYNIKRRGGHRFYRHATFYSYEEVVALLGKAGFSIEKVFSTLFQRPGVVEHMESPREGFYPDAGFTVILAGKSKLG
jgi:SAM-dependent methyltransferase